MKRKSLSAVVATVGLVLAGSALASPALADGGYNATVAGFSSPTPLVALATSSVQQVTVVNLPAAVGVYALHCKVPADPRQPPTVCDSSTDSLAYLPADAAARATVTFPLKINGEFFGTNPNPTAGPAAGESVDCRVATGNPRSTTCAVYILGAGKDSANPAYIRFFPTVFSPVKADRKTDMATVSLDGVIVKKGTSPTLSMAAPAPIAITTASGLVPSVSGDNCSVSKGTITALKVEGTCTLTITTTGGKNYLPLVTTQAFSLTK